MMRNESGVSLLETLIAFTVVVLVILSLLGTVSFALEGNRTAEGRQDAILIAQQLFETIRERELPASTGFNDAANARIPVGDPPFDNVLPPNTDYTRRIVTSRLATDPSDYRSRLYEVQVTVFWKIKERESQYVLEGLYREG